MNKVTFTTLAILFILSNMSIAQDQSARLKYYSDYYVFLADDGGSPLVIPLDFNWSKTSDGYEVEFKGWHGTNKDWPIAYFKEEIDAASTEIPQEAWQHQNGANFQFYPQKRQVIAKIAGAPKLLINFPKQAEWTKMPSPDNQKEIYASKTTVSVGKTKRKGWIIYERIRWDENSAQNFGDFQAFYWIPLVIDGVFYHFEQHKGEQTATKWWIADNVTKVEGIPAFKLDVLATTKDQKSGRDDIPQLIEISVPVWGISIKLRSGGSQVGYGPKFPKGLGYYRQSLLQSTNQSPESGYGMLELILENS